MSTASNPAHRHRSSVKVFDFVGVVLEALLASAETACVMHVHCSPRYYGVLAAIPKHSCDVLAGL